MNQGPTGDLYLRVRFLPHRRFSLDGTNIVLDLPLAPWEAALGTKVRIPTLDGEVDMTIPPGTDSGKKLRLRHRGLGPDPSRGDLLVRVAIKNTPGTDAGTTKTVGRTGQEIHVQATRVLKGCRRRPLP